MHARQSKRAYLQGGRQITDFEDNLMQATPDTTQRPVGIPNQIFKLKVLHKTVVRRYNL